jgi:hypothetical protein
VANILRDPTGLPFSVAAVSERENVKLSPVDPQQVVSQNVAFELAERSAGVKYPIVYVYCEKITNQLREKFRTFSGKARLAIDVRVSHDRLNGIEGQLAMYVEAVTDILDTRRGDWGQGMFYTGGYEVSFSATKHGGKNFIQTAKVTFDVDISSN